MLSYRCPVLSVTLVHCGQTVGRIKMKLGTQLGLGPRPHCVRWRFSCPTERGTATFHLRNLRAQALHASVQSEVHVCCSQTAGWINMKLGTKVGLGLRQIVINRYPELPSPKGAQPPIFSHVCCGQTAAWMHYAVQCHSRSPILIPIETSYTVYDFLSVINSLILTYLLSCTVSEI